MPNTKINTAKVVVKSHKLRTFFASVTGAIAVCLILSSVTVVWLNRTLTNTGTFVATVGPLASKPAIQNFVAEKVTDQLLKNASTQDLAHQLLPGNQIAAQASSVLQDRLSSLVQTNVQQVIQSPGFLTLWENTIRSAHASLVAQLNNGNPSSINLDLSPAINGVVSELKSTQLRPVADQITISPNAGNLIIKSNNLSRIHHYYELFKEGTFVIVGIAVLMAALAIWLSVRHGKTARRILLATGILALLQGLLLEAPAVVKLPGNDAAAQAAARTVAEALLHNLQVASLTLGGLCIVAVVGSILYVRYRH